MLIVTVPEAAAMTVHLPLVEDEEAVGCAECGDEMSDLDTAIDVEGWVQNEEGQLLCEGCAAYDGPTGPYDPAYYG